MVSTQNVTPQYHWSDIQQNHACAITKAIGWIYVAKQHKRASWLESETCQGKSRGIKGVEKLYRVYVGRVTTDLIDTHADGLLSRKLVKDNVIELIDSIVFGGEYGAFEEELVWFIRLIYAWINGVDHVLDVIARKAHVGRQLDGFVRSKL